MLVRIFSAVFLTCSLSGHCQQERVYLDLDKYDCRAGDTVRFKAYIQKGQVLSNFSTNLYVELFSEKGTPLTRNVFPVMGGLSEGQVEIPDSVVSANYYLRAFTRYQLNYDSSFLFAVPILVYNKDKPAPAYHKKAVAPSAGIIAGDINGVDWITSAFKGKISSLLILDSGRTRRFHVVKPLSGDSLLMSDATLTPQWAQREAVFPLDTAKANETLLLYEDSTLIGIQSLHLKNLLSKVTVKPDTLDNAPAGYNSWEIQIADTLNYYTSITVTDADKSGDAPFTVLKLQDSYTDNLSLPVRGADIGYLTFKGTATRQSGKKIKDIFSKEILIAGVKDSVFLFTKVVTIDSLGRFTIDSLFFFGDIDLAFQINKEDNGDTKNVKLILNKFIPPAIDTAVLLGNWEDDLKPADTTYTKPEIVAYELSKVKTLKPVVVKGWKSPRKELDNKYTTGAFSEPAMYSFDIRTEKRYHDIADYLRMNFPRFQGGYGPSDTPYDVMGHPYLFYVDEQPYSWPELQMFPWEKIAYIKCFESDFIGDDPFTRWKSGTGGFTLVSAGAGPFKIPVKKTPIIIAIYLRKGADFRTMPGGLNKLAVHGYSRILPFESDRLTLFWEPWGYGNRFRIRFTNHETTKRFRLKIEGLAANGKPVHYETVIE